VYGLLYIQMVKDRISRALAGITFTANAKTFIMACVNPSHDTWIEGENVKYNVPITSTLFERFDTKCRFKVIRDPDKVDEILKWRDLCQNQRPEGIFTDDEMAVYLNYARSLKPKMSNEAENILREYFHKLHDNSGVNYIPIGFRNHSTITKYAQALAKFFWSDIVTKEHAEKAIELYEFCLNSFDLSAKDGLTSTSPSLRDSNKGREYAVKIAFDKVSKEKGIVFKEDLITELDNRIIYNVFKDKEEIINLLEKMKNAQIIEIRKTGIRWLG